MNPVGPDLDGYGKALKMVNANTNELVVLLASYSGMGRDGLASQLVSGCFR